MFGHINDQQNTGATEAAKVRKMRKTGILTLYYKNYNFGGMLQAYALPRACHYLGVDTEQITYDYRQKDVSCIKAGRAQRIKAAFQKGVLTGSGYIISKTWNKFRSKTVAKKEREQLAARRKQFDKFQELVSHSGKVYTYADFANGMDQYSAIICGGDQIWNDWGASNEENAIKSFTLQFPTTAKKVSYGASTHTSLSETFLKVLLDGLVDFDFLAVREKSVAKFLAEKLQREVVPVLDPALLLTAEQWDEVAVQPQIDQKFVTCYFLGKGAKKYRAVERLVKVTQTISVTFPCMEADGYTLQDETFGDIRDFTSGPAEFVGLIKSAECVITDSFHAIVFSLIYHKPFYVFERNTQVGGGTMNSRIHDFLEEFGLKDRLVTPERLEKKKTIEPIDYTYADKVLARRRKESYDYLKTALGIQNEV